MAQHREQSNTSVQEALRRSHSKGHYVSADSRPLLRSGEEMHEQKGEGEIGGLERNEVETHLEERVATSPVVEEHGLQRHADHQVAGKTQRCQAGAEKTKEQHPKEIRSVVFERVTLETPHAFHIEDCRENEPNR